MRLATVRIENFRCLRDVEVDLDDLTALVGANGSGKSTVLRALQWFFDGGELEPDDIYRHQEDATVRVSGVFEEFTEADREALGSYAGGDTAIFTRTWTSASGVKLTGRAFTYPPFDAIRLIDGALPRRTAYKEYIDANPTLGLEPARNQEELQERMARFEQAHPELLEPSEADATHLFGFVGGAKLNGRFTFAFVPAVSDAQEQLLGARGSLLSRLLERFPGEETDVANRLDELKAETQRQADELIREQHADDLAALGVRITEAMKEFVPDADVSVDVQPPAIRVTDPTFEVHVADDGVSTDVGHQGHGFQRALLMAVLNELARAEGEGDVPAVLLAIEEPELYQHPLQARHFARVLGSLPRRGDGAFQVLYATHSQFFINPERYEQLRRFSRRRVDGERTVTVARVEAVAARLAGIVEPADIPRRIKMTLDRQIAEAVFADVALITEGKTDAGLLSGVAERTEEFEAYGVAVVNVEGKSKIPVAATVLGELGIPTYVVFDGDRGKEARMQAHAGGDLDKLAKIEGEVANTTASNRKILGSLGVEAEDWPDSVVEPTYAVFADRIEDEWPEAIAEAERLAVEEGDNPKREHWYHQAAKSVAGDPPGTLVEIVEAVRALR